jgi:hypothetical protein
MTTARVVRSGVAAVLVAGQALVLGGCADPLISGTVGGIIATTIVGGRSPSHEIEQVYYLGVFDPDDQVPPSLYRLIVRGQASLISRMNFASGWVPASFVDSLASRIEFTSKAGDLQFSTGKGVDPVTLKVGRRLVMFGPEGFREAPADHRLVVVMGSNPEAYFTAVEEVMGAVAAARKEQSQTAVDMRLRIREEMLKLAEERVKLAELRATITAEAKP